VAPLAVNPILLPLHMLGLLGNTLTVGVDVTVIVTVAVALHAPLVPVMVYVVVTAGLAVTVLPVVALSPAAGAQL